MGRFDNESGIVAFQAGYPNKFYTSGHGHAVATSGHPRMKMIVVSRLNMKMKVPRGKMLCYGSEGTTKDDDYL